MENVIKKCSEENELYTSDTVSQLTVDQKLVYIQNALIEVKDECSG